MAEEFTQYIKFSKVSQVAVPIMPTPSESEFVPGGENPGVSLPINYYVIGYIKEDVEVGKPIIIMRLSRNGVSSTGIMVTSIVERIEFNNNGLVIHTLNSIYNLEWLTKG